MGVCVPFFPRESPPGVAYSWGSNSRQGIVSSAKVRLPPPHIADSRPTAPMSVSRWPQRPPTSTSCATYGHWHKNPRYMERRIINIQTAERLRLIAVP